MNRHRSLQALLLKAFLPVVVLPILLIGLVTQWQYRKEIRDVERNIEQDLLVTAIAREKALAALVANVVDQARIVASAWPHLSGVQPNQALADFSYRSQAFNQLWVVSSEGRVRYSSAARALGQDLSQQAYWRQFRRSGEVILSDLVVESDGRRVVRIVLPIARGEALVATYRLSQLQDATRNPATIQLDRFSFIVDQHGRTIAHPDERVQAESRDLSRLPPVKLAMEGHGGTMVYRDPVTGQERSAVYLPMEKLGWALIATQPSASTMLASPWVANRNTLLIFMAGLALAVWVTTMLSHRLAFPFEDLSRKLQRLTAEEIRPGLADALAIPTGIQEYQQVAERAKALYETLAETIVKLEARTSEQELTNQQMAETVEALKRLDRLRADFLNILSHDLRIPLTAIIGYAELLQDAQDPPLGPGEQAYVAQIITACKRMQAMLEELLDYARLEVGRIKLHIEPVDPYVLIEETIGFFRPLAEQKRVALEVELPADLSEVLVDPDRLRQILNNLISNAIKYTPSGGSITVRAALRGDCVVFETQDTGIGLTVEDREHLFEKFYRSSRPEVQREKGSGLGLALIKGVIEAHEGHIEVESELGKGSTFRFSLPTGTAKETEASRGRDE